MRAAIFSACNLGYGEPVAAAGILRGVETVAAAGAELSIVAWERTLAICARLLDTRPCAGGNWHIGDCEGRPITVSTRGTGHRTRMTNVCGKEIRGMSRDATQ